MVEVGEEEEVIVGEEVGAKSQDNHNHNNQYQHKHGLYPQGLRE